jgi:hypothetical protein
LTNAIAWYVRYDENKCKSQQSIDFRNAVSNAVNRAIEKNQNYEKFYSTVCGDME